MLAKFSYQRAVSIKEAAEAAGRADARILAGGTDLLGCLRDGVFQANRLVSLNQTSRSSKASARSLGADGESEH